jgi:hypothetical protein
VFDFRLRVMKDDGSKGHVLDTTQQDVTLTDSVSAQARFSVSETAAGRLPDPFLVSVEYSTGARYDAPRHGLLIASKAAADSMDPPKSVSFTAVGFLPWLMARMYVQATAFSGLTRTWPDATPGELAAAVIAEAKVWGWGPNVSVDFTSTHDSYGVPWEHGDRSSIAWRVGTSMNQVLQKLAEQGKAEWWTEGTMLRMARPGSGVDRSQSVVLGGPAFDAAPEQSSFDDVFTRLTVFFDDDGFVNLENPGASTRFGALWSTMSQTGVKSVNEAIDLAQPALTLGRAKAEELSYDWTPAVGGPVPFRDFQIGDVVTARTRAGKSLQRVVGLVLSKKDETATVRAVVGSKMLGLTAKLAKRVAPATVGQISGGNGSSIPSAPGPTGVTPTAPSGLHVEANSGSWLADGSAVGTVVLEWNAVTQATDLSVIDVAEYEVWARRASEEAALTTSTSALSTTIDAWEPGVTRYVKVRARGFSGKTSAWSDEIAVVPALPLSMVPVAPTNVRVASNASAFQPDGTAVASIGLEWDPVTLSTDGAMLDVREYEVQVGLVTMRVEGTSAEFRLPAGAAASVRVRAMTSLGVWGDPSGSLAVVGALPEMSLPAPTTPLLTTGVGVVAVRWDGLVAGNVPPPAGFSHLVIETADDASGPWTPLGATLSGAGGTNIRGTVGEQMYVRLTSVDSLGRTSGVSPVATVEVVGIAAPDLEAGAVRANTIAAGAIEVQHVSPGFGGSLDISANDSVNILAGRIDEQQRYYRFDQDGLAIGNPESNEELRLSPGRIELVQDGVASTWWEARTMYVPEAVIDAANIGNHRIEKYGTRTVIRPL